MKADVYTLLIGAVAAILLCYSLWWLFVGVLFLVLLGKIRHKIRLKWVLCGSLLVLPALFWGKYTPEHHLNKVLEGRNSSGIFQLRITDSSTGGDSARAAFFAADTLSFERYSGHGVVPVSGAVFARLPAASGIAFGDVLSVEGTLIFPPPPTPIRDFTDGGVIGEMSADGFYNYLNNRGFAGVLYVNAVLARTPHGGFIRLLHSARDRIIDVATEGLDEEKRWLFSALLFGQRTGLEPEAKRDFLRAGTIHLFSVSGVHVAVVALLCGVVFHGLPWRMRSAATLLVLILYVVMCGSDPPAVRAGLMFGCYLLLQLCGVRVRPFSAVALAALLLIVWHPRNLFDMGFQFSFTVTAVLLLFAEAWTKLEVAITEKDMFRPRELRNRWFSRCWRKLVWMLLGALAAYWASMPILMYHQQIFTPMAVAANLLISPLLPLIFASALLKVMLCWVPGVSSLFLWICDTLLGVMRAITAEAAAWFAPAPVVTPPIWGVLLFLAALFAVLAARRSWKAAGFAVMGVLLVSVFAAHLFYKPFTVVMLGGDARSPMVAFADPSRQVLYAVNAPDYTTVRDILRFSGRYGLRRYTAIVIGDPAAANAGGLGALEPGVNLGRVIIFGEPTGRVKSLLPPGRTQVMENIAQYRAGDALFVFKNGEYVVNYMDTVANIRHDRIEINSQVRELWKSLNAELYVYR